MTKTEILIELSLQLFKNEEFPKELFSMVVFSKFKKDSIK